MLALAFDTDAAYRYLMPDAQTREAGLRRFFVANLRIHLPVRCTHVMLDASDQVLATVTLRPPRGVAISTLTMLRKGLVPFALEHGRAAVKRLFWLKSAYDALEAEASRRQPHWHVHMMAVRPDLQGQGLGSSLLRHVLDAAARSDAAAPTVLTTHLQANVTYYRRAGFEVSDERTLSPPNAEAYTVWSMRR
jgi:GNAT superfamily N-acetyltransferase